MTENEQLESNQNVLTRGNVSAALESIGERCPPQNIRLERRDDRWFAFLPRRQVAVFPMSQGARGRAIRERRVLHAVARQCSFAAPRLIAEARDGSFDLRAMVPGEHDADAVYARMCTDRVGARHVGSTLGAMIAELHTSLRLKDVGLTLPRRPDWPQSVAWIRERLPEVIDDRALHVAAARVIERYDESEGAVSEERVVVHTDIGLHNVSIDPTSLAVNGIFDWEDACWADRHTDFRHLVFGGDHDPLFDAAVATYEERTGVHIARARIYLHNAAMAITYLAFRRGVAAEARWCGRTLDEDIRWTRGAIARVERRT